MIDPGSYGELSTGCDNELVDGKRPGVILAEWLKANPSARLVILAGDLTADVSRPRDGHAHAGIQNVYFNDMRRLGVDRSRVLVCNYSVPGTNVNSNSSLNRSHNIMYDKSRPFIQSAPTSCPSLSGINYQGSWHP